jgi:hypothetical protein
VSSKKPKRKPLRKTRSNNTKITRSTTAKRQDQAHRKALEYIKRLGKRRAATRLETSVKELDGWLSKKFPTAKLTAAIGLGKPGGAYTIVKGADLAKWLKKVGHRKATAITGVPAGELAAVAKFRAKKGQRSGIRFDRNKLDKLIKTKGLHQAAELTGVDEASLLAATRVPHTETTRRLKRFVRDYGLGQTASYFGVSEKVVKKWTKTNVPPSWEKDVNRAAGNQLDKGASEEEVTGAKERDYTKDLARAWKTLSTWNKKVQKRFQVPKATLERWVRTGSFESNFAMAKKIYEDSGRLITGKVQPPPVKPPPPPSPTLFPEGPLPPMPSPTGPGQGKLPNISEIEQERLAIFKEARAEAFFKGIPDAYRPMNTWSRISQWNLTNRYGVRVFVKIHQFVHLLNLTTVGNKIIDWARKIWKAISGAGEFMTIRLTFSAMGTGNPFYAEAWVPDDKRFDFFTRSTDQISDVREVDYQVRSLLQDAYEVSREILLFFEHFEVVKSLPKEKTGQERVVE